MKKVLVVSEFIDPEQNSTGYFWFKVIQKLSRSTTIDKLSVIAPYSSNSIQVQQKLDNPVEFLLFTHASYNKNNLLARFLGQFRQTYGFFKILRKNLSKETVVVSGTNPLFLVVLLSILRFFIPFKWYLLVHDVFPENLVPAGLVKRDSIVFKLISFVFNRIYSSVDHLIVIGRDMKNLLTIKTQHPNITVIPNWVDFNEIEIRSKQQSSILERLSWSNNSVVFQFFGNIGRVQGIANLLAAICCVQHPAAKFLFIGGGSEVESVQNLVKEQTNNNVAYVGELSAQERSLGLSSCDVAVVTLAEGMLGLGVPSKAYFSMAADRPILAIMEEQAEVAGMVKEHRIGWVCQANDPIALAALIDQICQDKLYELVQSPRQVLQDHYHQDKLLQDFAEVVES
ncbi:glycosyltransferase family 4 protein [uncultured Acinetobacter sp.]|uniref:glycosyltransferase family 4 protein n=1 Tax=uncultured Acinetobacter sp. TaxID=165433 RepID=UPI0025830BE2|nr:glycosyltransferase family 4 protein [uncultured Acinetobacter sp.]